MANLLPQLRSHDGDMRPMSSFDLLQRQIDRIFDDFTSGWRSPDLLSESSFGLMPSIDVHEANGRVMAFQSPQDKAERDAPQSAPDKRPVHLRRRERERRRDPQGGAYPGVEQKPPGEQHGRGPGKPRCEP